MEKYVADVDLGNIEIYFEATGGTILGLHQMIVVENNILPKVEVTSLKTPWATGIFAGVDNNLTIGISNKESQSLENVLIEVYSNESDELIATYTGLENIYFLTEQNMQKFTIEKTKTMITSTITNNTSGNVTINVNSTTEDDKPIKGKITITNENKEC